MRREEMSVELVVKFYCFKEQGAEFLTPSQQNTYLLHGGLQNKKKNTKQNKTKKHRSYQLSVSINLDELNIYLNSFSCLMLLKSEN